MEHSARKPVVTVVTAVRRNPADLVRLVDALGRQTIASGVELVVVDNRSVRPSRPLPDLANGSIPVTVVREQRAGLSIARNRGIAAARGPFVAITDPDVQPEPVWLEQLLRSLADTGAFCVGGSYATVYPAGTAVPLTHELRQCHGPQRWPNRLAPYGWPYWISGCNMMFRRRTAQELGLFRTDLGRKGRMPLDCEDLEFVERATQAGLTVLIDPTARVIHPVERGRTTGAWLLLQGIGHGISVARMRTTATVPAEALHASVQDVRVAVKQLVGGVAGLDRGRGVEGARDILRIAAYHTEARRLALRGRSQRARSQRRQEAQP